MVDVDPVASENDHDLGPFAHILCCVRVVILSFRGYLVSAALTARYLPVFFSREIGP